MNIDRGLAGLTPFLDENGRLSAFPAKHKKKLLALWYLAGKIESGRQYSEPEINDLLDEWTLFHDPTTLRREIERPIAAAIGKMKVFRHLKSLSQNIFDGVVSRRTGEKQYEIAWDHSEAV